MSFGPITDRMRRPIPKVTERRRGGHAIELSHVRPDRQAPAVIGSTIGGHARHKSTSGIDPVLLFSKAHGSTACRYGDRATALAPHRAADRPTPEQPLQHSSMSAVSSATARHAHAARTALRNASAVPLAAPPPGPLRRPFFGRF
jgi:hypothetical protein